MAIVERTFYPDAHPETTTVDGYASHQTTLAGSLSWPNLLDAAGNIINDDGLSTEVFWTAYGKDIEDTWRYYSRGLFLFDTSEIDSVANVSHAWLNLWGHSDTKDEINIAHRLSINVYSSNPASNTELTGTDYTTLGSTPYCDTPIVYNSWGIDVPNQFVFNAAGRAAIAKGTGGITKLGIRSPYYDIDRNPPPWVAGTTVISCHTAGSSYVPELVVVSSDWKEAGNYWVEDTDDRWHHIDSTNLERINLSPADVDDTPVDAVTTAPISSNWAFDYAKKADDTRIITQLGM